MKMYTKLLMIYAILLWHEAQAKEESTSKYLKEYITGHIPSFPQQTNADINIPPKVEDSNELANKAKQQAFVDGRNVYKSLQQCEIEVTQRIKGVCEFIRPIGSACVSGDYMDVFNNDCMAY